MNPWTELNLSEYGYLVGPRRISLTWLQDYGQEITYRQEDTMDKRLLWLSFRLITIVALFSCTMPIIAMAADLESVTVFAAASTTNAMNDIGKMFAEKGPVKFVPSYASSSTLAKQIENGAPANVFISADEPWMNYLEDRKLIEPGSRFDLLSNKLVLIAPSDSSINKVEIGPKVDLSKLLENGKLATGDPDHVPVGKYAKAALEKLGVWNDIVSKLARAADVRGALTLVERGEASLGIVYATDAAITPKVKVVGVFPADTHPKIVYPTAVIAGKATAAAKGLIEFLKTPESKAVFEKYGFTTLP
jgi:molybdate transport system substrate-binding protein